MNRFGLALCSGGFRVALYHPGLIRSLRDAGILPRVTHFSSVTVRPAMNSGSRLGDHHGIGRS
jgi:hypothetical protein